MQQEKITNFGDVFLMLCRKATLLLLISLPIVGHALTWEEFLKSEMDSTYSALEEKASNCRKNRQPLEPIKESWFVNLSRSEKVAATGYIKHLAEIDCWGKELSSYNSALLAYTSESKDTQYLDEWIELSNVYRSSAFKRDFHALDVKPLVNWYKRQPKVMPFNMVEFLEQYPEFQKSNK
ncbi:hypothetical protein [Salinivibrio proteolyticus]|uniref:Lysozyme inhibitor LprI N-terminal domain-containing protein n=1 Tax=Salinivibrio proteolyticus TaxID=334715 RepID=A0ABY7LF81_9GAMM|nr:hypothetical protein [Salinivibrio proteolyticus]WBA15875.1 hypothetical protein N7E60_06320 [Salinivibrio proteolyticus]